jgi:hypothetical protein
MSIGAWLVLVFIVLPLLSALVWALARQSIVRVPMGSLGLMVVQGKSTNRSLVPGVHWVPALRKRQCVSYPAVELSYRASTDPVVASPVEASGPALRVVLGDRAEAVVSYTVRFQLVPGHLRIVHDRFGTSGYWSAVRDDSGAAVAATLAEPDVTLDSLYPGERGALELRLKDSVAAALAEDGMLLTGFTLGAVDLGRAGETVQATLRTRLELAKEEAGAALQELRVRHDAELAQYLSEVGDTALRYRQTDVWRDLAYRPDALRMSFPAPTAGSSGELGHSSPAEPGPTSEPDTTP